VDDAEHVAHEHVARVHVYGLHDEQGQVEGEEDVRESEVAAPAPAAGEVALVARVLGRDVGGDGGAEDDDVDVRSSV